MVVPSLISATHCAAERSPTTPLWQLSRMITFVFCIGFIRQSHYFGKRETVIAGLAVASAEETTCVFDVSVAREVQ